MPVRPTCSVEGCSLVVDSYKTADGVGYFQWCQKHRKRQPRKPRILDDLEVKTELEVREDGVPLCVALGCHRICSRKRGGGYLQMCDFHRRKYHDRPDKLRKKRQEGRLRKYGISDPEYQKMIETQQGLCAICHTRPGTAIDHCHRTGKVRALLCVGCNAGMGHFQENLEWMKSAIEYLKQYNEEIKL